MSVTRWWKLQCGRDVRTTGRAVWSPGSLYFTRRKVKGVEVIKEPWSASILARVTQLPPRRQFYHRYRSRVGKSFPNVYKLSEWVVSRQRFYIDNPWRCHKRILDIALTRRLRCGDLHRAKSLNANYITLAPLSGLIVKIRPLKKRFKKDFRLNLKTAFATLLSLLIFTNVSSSYFSGGL